MKPTDESCTQGSCDYWMVSAAAAKLGAHANTLGIRHIKDGALRLQFTREIAYYASSITNDVSQGKKSPEEGLQELKNEQSSLLSQSLVIAQKSVGLVAGAFQFVAGAGICYASVGTLCVLGGGLLMAHGANNVYENGRNLWDGSTNTEGPVREAYQGAAKFMGAGEAEGNIAYGVADLGLSAFGLARTVLKPDAWRLFKYVRTDYVRGYTEASKKGLFLEATSDGFTINSIHDELKK
ncbi:Protein of unknown function (DUF4225) [Pseudomonas syringae pv. syringae HS191]|uniref:DUF4225 domain-containing protein n=1 Tax=Pseudomonas syringae TaxID=317 RepID=UPI0006248948|nr:DUF4225 domain-containing protein [Pseudomonas syringae]AKF53473.1 Protein of unknown function (DUF4225) [Pseudomonas syringae pv. syringae HS191]